MRPVGVTDIDWIHEWAGDPVASRFRPWGPNTMRQTTAFVVAAVDAWVEQPQHRWVWVFTNAGGPVDGLGEVKLHNETRAEISYIVHPERWGSGLGTTVARELTRWSFAELPKLERMEATCGPRNVASEHILRRIGMTEEGTMRHTLRIRDGWRDSKIYSVLRAEWK